MAWFLPRAPVAAPADAPKDAHEQAEEVQADSRSCGGQHGGGLGILAPLLGLPLLVERPGRPGGVEADRAFGEGERDHQRPRHGGQRRQAGQLEGGPGEDGMRESTVALGCGLWTTLFATSKSTS